MINQFGQEIEVGDWVGYASKTGSCTDRKVGKVVRFGERKSGYHGTAAEVTAYVHWLYDGTWSELRRIDEAGKGVGIRRLFKLDPDGLERANVQ
jgi:hypothetical protein